MPASMGPLSADRGNLFGIKAHRETVLPLQWGRYQLIAEMWDEDEAAQLSTVASMGPLSADRGNHGRRDLLGLAALRFNGAAIS